METNGSKTDVMSVCVNIDMRPWDGVQPFGIPPTGSHGKASQKQSMLPWDSSSSYLTVLPQASPCSSKASWGAPGRVKIETHSSRTTAYHHQRTSVGPGEVFGLEPKEVSPFVLLYIFALLYSINFESLTHFVSPEFPPAASSHFRAFVKTPASHFFRRSTKAASMNLQDD